MQAVDGLHGGGRIQERRVRQRPLRDVDEHPEAVGDVLVEGPLQAEHDAPRTSSWSSVGRSPLHPRTGAHPPGTNSPSAGTQLEHAVGLVAASTSASWSMWQTTPERGAAITCRSPVGVGGAAVGYSSSSSSRVSLPTSSISDATRSDWPMWCT